MESTENVMLKIDFKNAFNTLRRDAILARVKDVLPDMYHFAYQSYASESNLYFREQMLMSSEGIQQGGPSRTFVLLPDATESD